MLYLDRNDSSCHGKCRCDASHSVFDVAAHRLRWQPQHAIPEPTELAITVTVDWGQFNEMANQASARGMDQARAQYTQGGDAQRAHDAAFTQPYATPGTPMSYQTVMGFSGTTYGSNAYYPSDPIMNASLQTANFLFLDNVRTLADPNASTGLKIMAGVGVVLTFLPAEKAIGIGAGLLAKSEVAGGHLIALHVGLGAAALDARLAAQARLPLASSFNSLGEAERALGNALTQNSAAVSSWLESGAAGRLTISSDFAGGTIRVPGGYSAEATGARFVLQGNGAGGYFILTGFPVP